MAIPPIAAPELETHVEGAQRPPSTVTLLAAEHQSLLLNQAATQKSKRCHASKTSTASSRSPHSSKPISKFTSPAYAEAPSLLAQLSDTMESHQASQFPRFSDGDVQVVVSSNKIYQLHSATLRRFSDFFGYLLDSEAPADLCSPARKAGRSVRYRFELVRPAAPATGVGVFQRTVGASSPL